MPILKSKKVLLYNAREAKRGIITVRVLSANYQSPDMGYSATVQDYVSIPAIEGMSEREEAVTATYVQFNAAEIDAAETKLALDDPMDLQEHIEKVILTALLDKIKITPLYDSIEADWELI